jgi:hypothetical protein
MVVDPTCFDDARLDDEREDDDRPEDDRMPDPLARRPPDPLCLDDLPLMIPP